MNIFFLDKDPVKAAQLQKKYSAKKDVEKILKYSKRKRNKLGQQIDQYWRRRDFQRLIDKGVIDTKIQMKEVKKLFDEIK